MKAVVLGGAGHMGRAAVDAALELPFIEQLLIADLDGAAARRVADASGSTKAACARIDVTESEQLRELLSSSDAVISTVGPFFRFGTMVLDAALAAGCHYIDICDDPGPTLELLERDKAAEQAGLCAIVGAGASPGISNLLAVRAIDGLDEIDTLITGWGTGGRPDEAEDHPDGAPAAIEHWVEQLTGPIPIHLQGEQIHGNPLEPVPVRIPGRDPVTAYTVGHPEPVTLPRYFPSIRRSLNVMDMPYAVMVLINATVRAVNSGKMTVPDASRGLARALYGGGIGPGGARTAFFALAAAVKERLTGKQYLPQLFALAVGRRDGQEESRAVFLDGTIPGGMGPLTCVPAVTVLAMLAAGEIERRGVFAPEAGVDPNRFFARLAPYVQRDPGGNGDGPVRILTER